MTAHVAREGLRFALDHVGIEWGVKKEPPGLIQRLPADHRGTITAKADVAIWIDVGQRSMAEWSLRIARGGRERPDIVGRLHSCKHQCRKHWRNHQRFSRVLCREMKVLLARWDVFHQECT